MTWIKRERKSTRADQSSKLPYSFAHQISRALNQFEPGEIFTRVKRNLRSFERQRINNKSQTSHTTAVF